MVHPYPLQNVLMKTLNSLLPILQSYFLPSSKLLTANVVILLPPPLLPFQLTLVMIWIWSRDSIPRPSTRAGDKWSRGANELGHGSGWSRNDDGRGGGSQETHAWLSNKHGIN